MRENTQQTSIFLGDDMLIMLTMLTNYRLVKKKAKAASWTMMKLKKNDTTDTEELTA